MSGDRLKALSVSIDTFLLNPAHHDVLTVVKGLRNGAVYGTKIRFPHALVMMMLFRDGTLGEKCHMILTATKTHARTLGLFVASYKALMLAQRYLREDPKAECAHDSFVAGLLGGYLVFGRGKQSAVNMQIVMYVFARVVLGLAKLSVKKGVVPDPDGATSGNAWPVFAALSWGCVMWLFRWHPEVVQSSLRNSMVYLYKNADHWDGWKTFLWHNS